MNSEEIIDTPVNTENNEEERIFHTLEKVTDIESEDNRIRFNLEKGEVVLSFLTQDIVRVTMGKRSNVKLATTPAVKDHNFSYDGFKTHQQDNKFLIKTEKLTISVDTSVFSLAFYDKEDNLIQEDNSPALGWSGDEVWAWKKSRTNERYYGLGEKTGFLDKTGREYSMWNTDVFESHVESTDPMYVSVPFFIGFNPNNSFGIFFDNSFKSHFDFRLKENKTYAFWAEGGTLDYYFINGPGLKDVVSKYSDLTGKMPLPPKWSLGYHQSRYSYKNEDRVREIANNFRQRQIPCDTIHLDIHYMDDYRVFTWDEDRFFSPEKMISDLDDSGFKIVNIIDPGVKKDPEYKAYQDGIKNDCFCKYMDGSLYSGDVWPGESVFPDFTQTKVRNWWKKMHRPLLEQGVRGLWNDMNEPAVFNKKSTMDEDVLHKNDGSPDTHKRFHNLYALLEGKATYNAIKEYKQERPFVLTRAGFAGIQRYAAVWTGDNRSFWNHLKLSIPMLVNIGLSGIPFCGADVGGFTSDSNGELLVRWTQLGALLPFFRNHCCLDAINQEPWVFGEDYEEIIKDYIKLRYRLLTYIYNLFYRSSKDGLPVVRPLVMEYPEDENTHNLSYQFMVGSDILVAPVYEPDKEKQMVYLPEGTWFNFFTGEQYQGQKYIIADAPLDTMPVFVKGGSIIPLTEVQNYVGEKELSEVEFHIYLSENVEQNSYMLYEDDGISFAYQDEEFSLTELKYTKKDDRLILNIENKHDQFTDSFKDYILKIKNIESSPEKIIINGREVNKQEYKICSNNSTNELTIEVSK